MNKNILSQIKTGLKPYKETIWVFKKATNTIGSNYDPYRDVGYISTYQSPIPVFAIVHQLSSSGLVAKELGLSLTGAIEIIVSDTEASIVKESSKLKYNNEYYTVYHENLGSKVLISNLPFNMKKIVCFVKGNS